LADRAHQAVQIVEARVDGGGQLGQDAGGLVLFLARGLHEIVVGLDDLLGLDEERLAALGAVVDDAAHAGPGLGPHRQHVAAVSKRDVPVGEEPVGVVALEGALELGGELSAPFADLAAVASARRAWRVISIAAWTSEGSVNGSAVVARSRPICVEASWARSPRTAFHSVPGSQIRPASNLRLTRSRSGSRECRRPSGDPG